MSEVSFFQLRKKEKQEIVLKIPKENRRVELRKKVGIFIKEYRTFTSHTQAKPSAYLEARFFLIFFSFFF